MVYVWLKNNFVLLLILLFSAALYSYRLNTLPSLYADEATEGYNAYSIWATGKDEYGKSFPLAFRLFGAYTPPLYIYLSAPIVGLLGTTLFNIRLLSVISGVISVFFFYKTLSLYLNHKFYISVGTFLYAILPWTVFNSRLGYEVMLGATLFNIGVYYLLSQKNLYLALFLISLSTYTAHTQKILAPIFLLIFLLIYKKLNFKTILFLLVTQLPNIYLMTTPAFWVKSNNLSSVSSFITQIISYLSPYTLFFQPQDLDKQHLIPQIGLYFWWMVIPLLVGIQVAPKKLLLWAGISLIPAALSGEFISVQRALPLLVPLMITISLGLQKINFKFLILLSVYSLLLLFRSYYILFPREMSLAWNYGYSDVAKLVKSNSDKMFLIDNTRNQGNYSLMLYLLEYSPILYHQTIDPKFANNYYQAIPMSPVYKFSNLKLRQIDWQSDACQFDFIIGDELSVSPQQEQEYQLKLENKIVTPFNEVALKIYSTHKGDTLCHDKNIRSN